MPTVWAYSESEFYDKTDFAVGIELTTFRCRNKCRIYLYKAKYYYSSTQQNRQRDRKEDGTNSFAFVGLCIIEIKTKSVLITVDDLEKHILEEGSNFNTCNVGNIRFKQLAKEPAYWSQIFQHDTAAGLKNVTLVHSIPGTLIKKIVIVIFWLHHLLTQFPFNNGWNMSIYYKYTQSMI